MVYKSSSVLLSVSQSLFLSTPIQCAPPNHFLSDFRPPPLRILPPSLKISAHLHEDLRPPPLSPFLHFRPPWRPIENSLQPPLVGERLVLKSPSN